MHVVLLFTVGRMCVHVCTCFFAGVGRYRNESYGEFLKVLNSAKRLNTSIGPREVPACIHTQVVF